MKKFLTFFAMMFALLGFSIPASAADYTVYVDVSAKDWSDCYIKTQWKNSSNQVGWNEPSGLTKDKLSNGVYKFSFSYGDLNAVIFSNNNNNSKDEDRVCDGTSNVGWFMPSKSDNWRFRTGSLITLSSGTSNSATVSDNYTPPYIYIDGASHPFTSEGSNWVYTVDAGSAEKKFRLQTTDSDITLDKTGTMASYTVIYGGTTTLGSSIISNEKIYRYSDSSYASGNYTARSGYTYKLSIGKTGYANAKAEEGNNSLTWTVTPTESKPATPVLPASATNNKIVIPAVSGDAVIYYTETATGDPSVDSWTEYPAGGIALEKGHTTIRAAAYKEGLGWSDVAAAKTYKYDLPEVEISIDVHTGKATLTPLVALNTLPASANAVILYSCGPAAPNKVYTPGTPVDMLNECTVDGATRYPIKALVRAWGDGDGSVAVANQSVDSDVRNDQWVGPAAVRRICLWSYGPTGNPVRVGEFTKQDATTYVLSYSPISGTDASDASQHYFIRVVMNHDEPNNVASDAGGTFYSLGNANEVVSVASGTEYTSFNLFTPSKSDTRGMFFDGADRDAVKLTLKGDLDDFTHIIDGSSVPCKRFVPNSIVPEWNPDANIKSVELRDANNKLLCTLTQNLGTGEDNYWTGVTTEALKQAQGGDNANPAHTKYCFVVDTKDGKKYYSLGTDANYWLNYGRYDSNTTPAPSTSATQGNYFCVNEPSAIAEVAISFDGTTASKISISPYTTTKQMDISGDPNAPSIIGYGSEVGSWDNEREFNRSATLGGWVYTFTATQSTGEYLIYGSKGNLYAPIGLQLGSPSTTIWRQVPSGLDANAKARYAAKMPGLQIGARYRLHLTESGSDVLITIEALPESVRKIKKVELVNRTASNSVVGEFTYDAEKSVWNYYPLSWTGNPSNGNVYSDSYYIKATIGYEGEGDASDMVRYIGWSATVNDYQCSSISQYTNKPSTYANLSDNRNFKVRVNGDYYVQVAFDESALGATWMGVATTQLTPSVIPTVNRVAWSLSDDKILAPGDTKYFYMSAIQNDNRLSPEWELVKKDGKYVLDNFVVIPAAQFVIRAVHKSNDGKLTVTDWGYKDPKGEPYHIYATKQDFNLDNIEGGVPADAKIPAQFTMSAGCDRGFFWNVGASMVSLEFDPSAASDNLTATIDFSYPSTLQQAPKHGFPWVGLTSSNIQAFSGSNQTYTFTADLGHSGISADDLKNIGVESTKELQAAFTNAFIQWTEDGKPYIYDRHVGDTDANGKRIYYVESNDNRATTCKPDVEHVMNSTILPPRTTPQFKMITTKGVTTPDADALTFKYTGEETRTFTDKGNTTRMTKFAVYEIENIELQGMFKVFTGYGARTYGSVTNGLSWFPNWGVGTAEKPYSNILIDKTISMPMNGGGQIIVNKDGKEVSQQRWDVVNLGNNGDYNDDNAAGQYFRLDNAQYVSKLKFYLALECDTEDRGSKTFHNPEGTEEHYYNDGRNYSWLDVTLEAERPVIQLNKQGANTGMERWWLNTQKDAARPKVHGYRTKLVREKGTLEYDENTGKLVEGTFDAVSETPHSESNGNNYIEEKSYSLSNLPEGTYYAFIYVDYEDVAGTDIKPTDRWNISHPITIFSVKQGEIRGAQRVGEKNGAKVYHPAVRVTPDIQTVIKGLPSGITLDQVSAKVTVGNLRADSQILTTDDKAIEKKDAVDPAATDIYYVVTQEYKSAEDNGGKEQEGKAVVYYPNGYLTADRAALQEFVVFKSRLNALTHLTLEVAVESADNPEPVTAEVMTYMPAGKLYGSLVAQKKEDGDVKFNALAVTTQDDLPANEARDGYARIRYADRYADDAPCYIGSMDGTGVFAQVYYVGKNASGAEVDVPLFDEDALLDMKANPDDDLIYTAKRLKIGGIPYVTENDATDDLATDINGDALMLRHDQKAKFKVVLTYKNEGIDMPVVTTRTLDTELTYGEENLTSPRQGLKDVLTQADADARLTDETVAKDVTAVSERYVENYGGLFTNIEDAHVALHAVEKNNALVGSRSLRKWYMDHGDKWPGTEDLNPFNPGNHLAIGNAKNNGSTDTYANADEVHPMLRNSATKVTSTDGFRNDSKLNNAWWNHNALVAPEFHEADQINGTLTIEGGKVTGFTSGSAHPKNHRAYWAGVKPGNSDKYQVWDGGYVIKAPEGFDVDIRDPQHGYYGMSNHFSTKRSGFYLGEMPLDANDVTAVLGRGNGMGSGSFTEDQRSQFYEDAAAVHAKAMEFHKYSEAINAAVNAGNSSVTVGNNTYPINWNKEYIWDYDPIYDVREKAAFEPQTAGGLSPAEELFETADRHMFFKVRHINHESWFVPGASVAEGSLKTQPLWAAFENDAKFQAAATPTAKDNYVMSQLRVNPEDYCPLAYDVRYTYPFLTSDKYVTAENYDNSKNGARRKARSTEPGAIKTALDGVGEGDVDDIVARDKGRVSFFGYVSPEDVVPTAISDVNDDIRGNGFSIVYNRAAGTVTVKAEGKTLENAAVYDASGASLVTGTSADRIDDSTIVLDVRNIARGAYVVSTNLGGAKFMK